MVADVDDEQRVGQRVHLFDAAQTAVQLVELTLQSECFALAHFLEGAVLRHGVEIFQALDRCFDRLEVGKHPSQPAMIDIRHAGALRFLGDNVTRLTLGADKKYGAAVGCQLADVLHRLLVHRHRLFEIDDVNLVALPEDIVCHLRVPIARLVPEMDARLQHLTHRNRHHYTPYQG